MLGTAKLKHRKSISEPTMLEGDVSKRNYEGIHDRFLKDSTYRDSQLKNWLDWRDVHCDGQISTGKSLLLSIACWVRKISEKTGISRWTHLAEMHRWNSDQTSEKHLQICTVSTVNLQTSDLNQFLFINTKVGIRRLLHPVPHGGSGMNTGGAQKIKDWSCNERPQRTGRPVLDTHSSRHSEWNFDKIFYFVVLRSFTADSNLLQPTGGVKVRLHQRWIFWRTEHY